MAEVERTGAGSGVTATSRAPTSYLVEFPLKQFKNENKTKTKKGVRILGVPLPWGPLM